jgi:hypothetical protein
MAVFFYISPVVSGRQSHPSQDDGRQVLDPLHILPLE